MARPLLSTVRSLLRQMPMRLIACPAVLAAAMMFPAWALASPLGNEPQVECTGPDSQGIRKCHAGLDADAVSRIQVSQQRSQWCWAASVSMLLSFHGMTVAQEQIVTERYGQPDDLPAASAQDMTQALLRTRASQGSTAVKVSTRTAESSAGLHVNNLLVLAELLAQRPMLVGRAAHAMVLVHVRYERFPNGAVRVVEGTVIDPAPGLGVRNLAPHEMRLSYLAAVQPDTSGDSILQQ